MAEPPDLFTGVTGFQWDDGNSEKNWIRHRVSRAEAEQVFFNQPLIIVDDTRHSRHEKRYFALGRDLVDRELALIFTIRDTLIRVISVRPMSRRERVVYARAKEA